MKGLNLIVIFVNIQHHGVFILKDHAKSVHDGFMHKCELCDYTRHLGKLFLRKFDMYNRSRVGFMYKCKLCDYKASRILRKITLTNIYNLFMMELHIIARFVTTRHLGRGGGGLKKHVQSVHEKVQFNCELCDFAATTRSNLKRHERSVHEGLENNCEFKYNCECYAYKANQKGDLKKHVQSVHDGVTYDCELCDYKVPWKGGS